MQELPPSLERSILLMLADGKSSRKIASELFVSHTHVNRVRKLSPVPLPKCRAGRPGTFSDRDRRRFVRLLTSRQFDNASQLRKACSLSVSTQTVRNALKTAGLKAVVKVKRPLLKAKHRKARLNFAHKHLNWTMEDWSQVIFSDETKINRMGSDGRVWVWKRKGEERYSDRLTKPTVKHGGGNVMIWGTMSIGGVGLMEKIDGIMDGVYYQRILDRNLFKSAQKLHLRHNFIFQQDGDSKHTAKQTTEWFEDHRVKVLNWPSQSPDLNPIEHLWTHIKNRLNDYPDFPSSLAELERRIEVEWNKIPVEVCRNLVESMPKRLAAVIKAKGGHTRY